MYKFSNFLNSKAFVIILMPLIVISFLLYYVNYYLIRYILYLVITLKISKHCIDVIFVIKHVRDK